MWKNGIALAKYDPDVIVVKVPGTFEGIKAANALVTDGIRVTITARSMAREARVFALRAVFTLPRRLMPKVTKSCCGFERFGIVMKSQLTLIEL